MMLSSDCIVSLFLCFVFAALSVHEWSPQDVGLWLESLGLSEYRNAFISNDIRGQELLGLGRTDLKVGLSVEDGNKDIIIFKKFIVMMVLIQ